MKARRLAKVSEAIRETASSTILFGLKDPRVKNVTVTHVETAPDLRTAKVYVSIMGDEREQALCLHGLNSARGFVQRKIADRLQTRYTPVLRFIVDQGVKKSIEASRILRETLAEDRQHEAQPTDTDRDSPERGVSGEGETDEGATG